jgi:hypothetical protein
VIRMPPRKTEIPVPTTIGPVTKSRETGGRPAGIPGGGVAMAVPEMVEDWEGGGNEVKEREKGKVNLPSYTCSPKD